jgi:hypothetical protein
MAAPYPRGIAFALRMVTPLTVVVSLTALYALYVRIDAYGSSVERVWAVIVACAALAYSIGYTWSAWRRGAGEGSWMSGMSRVNVFVAYGLIAILALALTPLLSPYRIAAGSQYRVALAKPVESAATRRASDSPFVYLRFSAGDYGVARLERLAKLDEHPRAEEIRKTARAQLDRKTRWAPAAVDAQALLAELQVHPSGRSVDEALRKRLEADMRNPPFASSDGVQTPLAVGLFIDLNDDDIDEFVLFMRALSRVYELDDDQQWSPVGTLHAAGPPDEKLKEAIEQGDVTTETREWRDLIIGELRYRLNESM